MSSDHAFAESILLKTRMAKPEDESIQEPYVLDSHTRDDRSSIGKIPGCAEYPPDGTVWWPC